MSNQQPIDFKVAESEFDLSLLPEESRVLGSETFHEAVTRYYKDAYREAGGRVDVAFAAGQIEVSWQPQSDQLPASATIAEHLEAGRYDQAIPLLKTRLQLQPDDTESLYNLGMVYSDRQQYKEARELLTRAVELEPGFANAYVALGVAALRAKDLEAAQAPLEKAVVLEPRNPFALRTLGQLCLMRNDPEAALPHLRNSARWASGDAIALFTLAQCLLGIGDELEQDEGAELLDQALALAPHGELAEKIKQEKGKLARKVMRAKAGGIPRMDVVMYCTGALEALADLNREQQMQVLLEVAAVGQKGLAINDPDQRHHLNSYRGGRTVSALQLACILFVATTLLLPGQNTGLDFEKEYELAQAMAKLKPPA